MSLLEPAHQTNQPLVYLPLDPSKEEIRLIILHSPLKDDSTLRCTFFHMSFLSDAGAALKPPSYETLSYVWGKPYFSDSIIVNNQQLHITPNLAKILPSLRHETEPRLLWIDAICINQEDLVERAQQVTLMRKVYSSCRRVLAWVGPTQVTVHEEFFAQLEYWDSETEKLQSLGKEQMESLQDGQRQNFKRQQEEVVAAMELLRKIVDRDSHTLRTFERNYARTHRGSASHINPQKQGENSPCRDAQSAATEDIQLNCEAYILGALLRNPTFWSRVWIVQEISCAPQVTLLCGRTELEWACISEFLKDEPYFDAFHAVEISHGRRFTSKKNFRRIFTNAKIVEDQRQTMYNPIIESANTFLDVLTRFRDKEAADPRDKIYALLGLVSQRHDIKVDYNKTLERLYQEVTLALIRISGNLDIICQNPFGYRGGLKDLREARRQSVRAPHAHHETMPSWAAEFHLQRDECLPVMFAQRNIFNAGLKTESVNYHVVGKHMNVLALRGTVIDCIGSKFPNWGSSKFSQSKYQSEEDKSRIHSVLQHSSLRDGRHGYSVPDILRSIYEDRVLNLAANSKCTLAEKIAVKAPGDSESPTRAFWRTLVKDCTVPPRMRRLMTDEIEELDTINTPSVKAGEPPCTYEATDDPDALDMKPKSTWPPLEAEGTYIFAVSLNGLYLLTRPFVEEGDIIAVLDGAKVPVILRRGEIEQAYEFVCVAYVHGIMDGEIEEAVSEGWLQKEEILLA